MTQILHLGIGERLAAVYHNSKENDSTAHSSEAQLSHKSSFAGTKMQVTELISILYY